MYMTVKNKKGKVIKLMNKADKYIVEAINNILENGYWDRNPRPKYPDGTPAYTKSVNQVIRNYDLSKGEFPITSLRPIAWKSAIKEIFWIFLLIHQHVYLFSYSLKDLDLKGNANSLFPCHSKIFLLYQTTLQST